MVRILTRRQAVIFLALIAGSGTLSLTGCGGRSTGGGSDSADTGSNVKVGLSSDTQVKDYPVELLIYADSDIAYYLAPDGTDRIAYTLASYQQQDGRADVTAQIIYVSAAELAEYARSGFPEGDAVIALASTVQAAQDAGTIDAGAGGTSIRKLQNAFAVSTHVVRSPGSAVELSAVSTLDGQELSGQNRLKSMADVEGTIAIADPTVEPVGISANKLLYAAGLYTSEDGTSGTYAASIADKIVLYPTQDEAMQAVGNGTCVFGFAFAAGLSLRYPEVEDYYTPSGASNTVYWGAALSNAAEPGVAKDFLQYMTVLSG